MRKILSILLMLLVFGATVSSVAAKTETAKVSVVKIVTAKAVTTEAMYKAPGLAQVKIIQSPRNARTGKTYFMGQILVKELPFKVRSADGKVTVTFNPIKSAGKIKTISGSVVKNKNIDEVDVFATLVDQKGIGPDILHPAYIQKSGSNFQMKVGSTAKTDRIAIFVIWHSV